MNLKDIINEVLDINNKLSSARAKIGNQGEVSRDRYKISDLENVVRGNEQRLKGENKQKKDAMEEVTRKLYKSFHHFLNILFGGQNYKNEKATKNDYIAAYNALQISLRNAIEKDSVDRNLINSLTSELRSLKNTGAKSIRGKRQQLLKDLEAQLASKSYLKYNTDEDVSKDRTNIKNRINSSNQEVISLKNNAEALKQEKIKLLRPITLINKQIEELTKNKGSKEQINKLISQKNELIERVKTKIDEINKKISENLNKASKLGVQNELDLESYKNLFGKTAKELNSASEMELRKKIDSLTKSEKLDDERIEAIKNERKELRKGKDYNDKDNPFVKIKEVLEKYSPTKFDFDKGFDNNNVYLEPKVGDSNFPVDTVSNLKLKGQIENLKTKLNSLESLSDTMKTPKIRAQIKEIKEKIKSLKNEAEYPELDVEKLPKVDRKNLPIDDEYYKDELEDISDEIKKIKEKLETEKDPKKIESLKNRLEDFEDELNKLNDMPKEKDLIKLKSDTKKELIKLLNNISNINGFNASSERHTGDEKWEKENEAVTNKYYDVVNKIFKKSKAFKDKIEADLKEGKISKEKASRFISMINKIAEAKDKEAFKNLEIDEKRLEAFADYLHDIDQYGTSSKTLNPDGTSNRDQYISITNKKSDLYDKGFEYDEKTGKSNAGKLIDATKTKNSKIEGGAANAIAKKMNVPEVKGKGSVEKIIEHNTIYTGNAPKNPYDKDSKVKAGTHIILTDGKILDNAPTITFDGKEWYIYMIAKTLYEKLFSSVNNVDPDKTKIPFGLGKESLYCLRKNGKFVVGATKGDLAKELKRKIVEAVYGKAAITTEETSHFNY